MAQQLVFFEHFRQQCPRLIPGGGALPGFRFDAVPDRLPEQCVRLLLPDQSEQVPGAIRQHHTVDFRVVLHGEEEMIERVVGRALRERRKGSFRRLHFLASHGLAQDFAARINLGERRRFDRMQHFLFAPAAFLDAIGIAVKHLEDRQRLQFGGELLRHV